MALLQDHHAAFAATNRLQKCAFWETIARPLLYASTFGIGSAAQETILW